MPEITVTNAQFAEWAARIASCAAAWAGDNLTCKDEMNDPVRPDVTHRFTQAITHWLDAINGHAPRRAAAEKAITTLSIGR